MNPLASFLLLSVFMVAVAGAGIWVMNKKDIQQ